MAHSSNRIRKNSILAILGFIAIIINNCTTFHRSAGGNAHQLYTMSRDLACLLVAHLLLVLPILTLLEVEELVSLVEIASDIV
jgi:glucan phosphoethanolaminetransferase (alkaline phosphatase superfamily)